MNRLIFRILFISLILAIFAGISWTGYEFLYKGTITIEQTGDSFNARIVDANGNIVAAGQTASYRINPGTYTISATNNTSGINKTVTVNPFSDTKITMQSQATLAVTPLAKIALYGAFTSGGSILGMDPSNSFMVRVDSFGNSSRLLTKNILAGQEDNWEAELPNKIINYQPYLDDQVLISTDGILYAVSRAEVTSLDMSGITIDSSQPFAQQVLIATKNGSPAFVVAYKQEVYYYENVNAAPKKIYTANKKFDSIIYGGNTIGLYYSNMPTSQQDLSSLYSDYQMDMLLINTTSKEEQTIKGIINNATLSPDGALATVQPRASQAYLYNVNDKKRTADIDAPLIAGPVWLDATNYIYGKKATVYKYNTQDQSSALLGSFPNDVTYIRKESNTDGYIITTYTDKQNAVVYRLGGSTEASDKYAKIRSILPVANENYSINFTSVSTPTILIETYAPLNTASQLPRYRQETAKFRQDALNYLASNGVDLTGITIIYSPADPL